MITGVLKSDKLLTMKTLGLQEWKKSICCKITCPIVDRNTKSLNAFQKERGSSSMLKSQFILYFNEISLRIITPGLQVKHS